MFLFTFFRCGSFLLWWTLTPLHFITAVIYKIVLCFFQRNWSPCFLPFALALFLLSTSMKALKLIRIKESALLLLFLSLKVQEAMQFTVAKKNARVFEMQNFIPAYMMEWTYVRTYSVRTIFSEPKFLGCVVYQIILPWCSAVRILN